VNTTRSKLHQHRPDKTVSVIRRKYFQVHRIFDAFISLGNKFLVMFSLF